MKKKFWIVLLVIFSVATSLYAMQEITDQKEKQDFAKTVRLKGYACERCVRANFMGKKHHGLEFRIICDEERNAFRVILTPNNKFIVEPW